MSDDQLQHLTNDDGDAWEAHWQSLAMLRRTEPGIDADRTAYLARVREANPRWHRRLGRLACGLGQREGEPEGRAFPDRALDAQHPTMGLDDGLADVQTQAEPTA